MSAMGAHLRPVALLIDVDGVLTQAGVAVPGAPAALRALREREIPFLLVTNTSQRSRDALARQLTALGLAVEAGRIITPAVAAARYLAAHGYRAYLATRASTRDDFLTAGVVLEEEHPDAVVLGDLGDELTYDRLNRILRHLLAGAELIALGRTRYWQAPDGPAIDVGALAALFEAAAGVRARVFGKPEPSIFIEAASMLGVSPSALAMIGDDAEVDVAAARRAGLGAGILVQTGKYRPGDEQRHTPAPDAVYPSFPSFIAALLGTPITDQ